MIILGSIISLQFIILTAWWLIKKHNPQAVLLVTGLMMLTLSVILGINTDLVASSTGSMLFDLFKSICDTFTSSLVKVGFMIMAIGGYVAFMKHIRANDALVYVSMQPLSLFKKCPYIAAILIIPIGQILFICIQSATGLGLLLAVSIFPVLVSLGVSRLTAASVIAVSTVFDMGPSSANTAKAAELVGLNNITYFVEHQLPIVLPMIVLLMVLYYFTSRYFDKRDVAKGKSTFGKIASPEELKIDVPLIYAILPVLPLLLLVIFSKYLQLFNPPIDLDVTTAIMVSLFIAVLFELVRKRSLSHFFNGVKKFWEGMGKVFADVVTLIVCAEIFASGLIGMGFIDALVQGSKLLGFSGVMIGVLIAVIIFLAAILMGSGNASFFSFGPLIPNMANQFELSATNFIVPIQLSTSMGRTVSPISGVIIAIAEIAGVSPFDLTKRNAIPMVVALIFMLLFKLVL